MTADRRHRDADRLADRPGLLDILAVPPAPLAVRVLGYDSPSTPTTPATIERSPADDRERSDDDVPLRGRVEM